MKIKNIRIEGAGENVRLVADCKIRPIGWDTVYFSFPIKYRIFISKDASPFAAALLIPSMRMGQDLIIEDEISQELYYGMHKIMDIMLGWNIGLKKINIKARKIVEFMGVPKEIGTFFSGGVDSFYTYLSHKNDVEKIKYFILIRGYDIPLKDENLWNVTVQNVRNIAREEGIELIEVESNIRPPIDSVMEWDYSHGGCLAAVGLCLRGRFKKIYIPSTYTKEQNFSWGSHFLTDKNWSTETLAFVHDGEDCSRVNKVISQVSHSPTALKYLRICYLNKGNYNCGNCDKCLRTMINLYVCYKLDECDTLPHTIDPLKVAKIEIEGDHGAVFQKENLKALRRLRPNPELEQALVKSLLNVNKNERSSVSRTKKKIFRFDAMYMGGFFYKKWMSIAK